MRLLNVVVLEHMVDEYLLWDPSGLTEPEGVLLVVVIYQDLLRYIYLSSIVSVCRTNVGLMHWDIFMRNSFFMAEKLMSNHESSEICLLLSDNNNNNNMQPSQLNAALCIALFMSICLYVIHSV